MNQLIGVEVEVRSFGDDVDLLHLEYGECWRIIVNLALLMQKIIERKK